MALKNKVQVLIEGRTMTLVGTESEEYLKKVASYIDGKILDVRKIEASKSLSASMASVLTSINVADDYFKELEKNILLNEQNQELKLNMFNAAKENEDFCSEINKIKSQAESSASKIDLLNAKNSENSSRIYKLTSENNLIRSDLNKLTNENAKLKSDLNRVSGDNQNLKTEIIKIRNEKMEMTRTTTRLNDELDNLKEEYDLQKSMLNNVEYENSNMIYETARLKEENIKSMNDLKKFIDENSMLKNKLASEDSQESILEDVMPAIHEVVSDNTPEIKLGHTGGYRINKKSYRR